MHRIVLTILCATALSGLASAQQVNDLDIRIRDTITMPAKVDHIYTKGSTKQTKTYPMAPQVAPMVEMKPIELQILNKEPISVDVSALTFKKGDKPKQN